MVGGRNNAPAICAGVSAGDTPAPARVSREIEKEIENYCRSLRAGAHDGDGNCIGPGGGDRGPVASQNWLGCVSNRPSCVS